MSASVEEFGQRRALDRQERSPSALRAAARRSTTAWALALAAVLVGLLHETLGGDLWLTQADALLDHEPWIQAAPEGYRAGNPLLLDQTLVVHPWLQFAREELAAGRLPLWNPYDYLGQPLHAAYTGGLLWPLNWIYLATGSWAAYAWIAWAELLLAGMGMLLLLRVLGLSPAPSAVGAVGYALCGFNIAWLGHPHTGVAALFPWALIAIELAIARPGPACAIPVALAAAGMLVAGHVQTASHCAIVLFAWILARTFTAGPRQRRARAAAWGTLASGAVAGLLLSAPAWLPFVEYVGHSRAGTLFETEEATSEVRFTDAAPMLFDPDHHGDPRRGDYDGPLGDHLNFSELIGPYVGIGVLVLALGGTIANRRDPRVRFLFVLFVVALCLAWQLPPFWDWLREVPRLRSTKLMRFGLFAAFAACALAAWGLEYWRASLDTDRGRRALSIVSFLIVSLELLDFGRGFNPATDPALVVPDTPTTTFLELAQDEHGQPARALGVQGTTLFPNANLFHRIAVPGGYDSIEDEAMAQLVGQLTTDPRAALFVKEIGYFDRAVPLASLLGLRWVLSHAPVADLPRVHESPTGLGVHLNQGALPRVFLAESFEHAPDPELRLARLGAEDFDPRTALVETLPPGGPPPGPLAAGSELELSWTPGAMTVELSEPLGAPGLLVVTETFDAGWRASVDGEEVQVERVDHALSGLWLKSDARRIELRYAPTSWSRGLACLAAGLAWLAASLGWSLRRSS